MQFDQKILNLANSIGEFIEYWGFRKIDGKIWVLIYLADEPIDAGSLIKNLDVSKGLISTSLKTLIDYKLIEEIEHGDNRSKYYRALDEPMAAIINVLKQREAKILNGISNSFKELNTHHENVNSKRLKSMGSLIKMGDKFLRQVIKFKKLFLSER